MTTLADRIPRLKYTLVFITCGEEVLLLCRRYDPNRDLWNGVGGKLEPGETPLACAVRETREETGIELASLRFGGTVTWNEGPGKRSGMYVYLASVERKPWMAQQTSEGPLFWWSLNEVLESPSVVDNIPEFLPAMLAGLEPREWACEYDENRQLVNVTPLPLAQERSA